MSVMRMLFVLAGVVIFIGGYQHPRDATMAQMLANPTWFMSHFLVSVGLAVLLAALWLFRRLPGHTLMPRATTAVIVGTVLQLVEMVVHTAAMVDHGNLVAGHVTPVLTAHLAMSVVLYPVFGATAIWFIVAGMRSGAVGSPWIAWLGIAGAAAHGLSAPLFVGLGIAGARILFPMMLLFAIWLVLAGVWPARVTSREPVAAV